MCDGGGGDSGGGGGDFGGGGDYGGGGDGYVSKALFCIGFRIFSYSLFTLFLLMYLC